MERNNLVHQYKHTDETVLFETMFVSSATQPVCAKQITRTTNT